ncbi:D-tyrosyl-tRNA(Tyr) deacylase [Pilibacter termitis]|uniref:D-aminoacyl-tRNA deacylase n=1 Tax=Pilibacter termitis TaxID=263852 RepID=A0A1T4PWF8_9ENTE|nr:D-aminoacyl-tRNA deacylase [Pilibacter termitis]SJZ95637.1 D-tyrosyl-tRNA(Tyr) deacylase [Pilibacter termitis]
MKAVIQKVSSASVKIEGKIVGEIKEGFMILLGVHEEDTQKDVDYLVRKITGLRVFEDENEKMNLSLQDVGGSILSISQFTLYAETKKGNRPSFIQAAKPEVAIPLYEAFNAGLRANGLTVAEGEFGAMMDVSLVNSGPVTIIMDTREQ